MNRRYFLAGALAVPSLGRRAVAASNRVTVARIGTRISNALVHLGNIVARTGRPIRFDPRSETVVNDPEANRYVKREYRQHWSTPKGV